MRRVGFAIACSLAFTACNPVETSRSFDSSRGTKRFALITRFPADLIPRVFEQDGAEAAWTEVAVEGASTIGVSAEGPRLTVPAAEEVLILEYYAEELSLLSWTPAEALAAIRIGDQPEAAACQIPLCFGSTTCRPASPQIVVGPEGRNIGLLSRRLVRCK